MIVDWTQPPEALEMLKEALQIPGFVGPCHWLAVRGERGEILATFAFHNFGLAGCEWSVAIFDLRPSRHVLKQIFAYPFHQLGLRRITGIVRETNKRSFDITSRLGFRVEGLLRDWYPDCNGILLGMTKEECKWL